TIVEREASARKRDGLPQHLVLAFDHRADALGGVVFVLGDIGLPLRGLPVVRRIDTPVHVPRREVRQRGTPHLFRQTRRIPRCYLLELRDGQIEQVVSNAVAVGVDIRLINADAQDVDDRAARRRLPNARRGVIVAGGYWSRGAALLWEPKEIVCVDDWLRPR